MPNSDQVFFLRCQICDFVHRLLIRVVPRNYSPDECYWDELRTFDFDVGELLGILEFNQKTEFWVKALKAERAKVDVERERRN